MIQPMWTPPTFGRRAFWSNMAMMGKPVPLGSFQGPFCK